MSDNIISLNIQVDADVFNNTMTKNLSVNNINFSFYFSESNDGSG